MLLDLDDTLIDTRTAMHAAGTYAAGRLWPGASPERLARSGERFRADPGRHFGAFTRGEVDFAEMRRRRIAELAAWLGQAEVSGQREAFEAAYEPEFTAGLRVFNDVAACLAALANCRLPVGVLTNSGADYTQRKLAETGLAPLLGTICTRDTLGIGKPDPRAFHEACRQLGTAPAQTLYVGDEWLPDALGAADAGLIAAWLVRDPDTLDDPSRERAAGRGIPILPDLLAVPALAGCASDLGARGSGR
ncbi:MAG: HAD family hydrolase [Tetrasphaera sp.]